MDEQIKKIKALEEKIIKASGNPAGLFYFLQSEGLPVLIELLSIAHSQALLIQNINRRLSDVETEK